MSDILLAQDPIVGWEAINTADISRQLEGLENPYDWFIENAWQQHDREVDAALDAGEWRTDQMDKWLLAMEILRKWQDKWTIQHTDCECTRPEGSCYYCQALHRLTYCQ